MAAKFNPVTAPNLSLENQSMQMETQIATLKWYMTIKVMRHSEY